MGMAENTRERGREQVGMTREGRRTMEKVLENTVRDSYLYSVINSYLVLHILLMLAQSFCGDLNFHSPHYIVSQSALVCSSPLIFVPTNKVTIMNKQSPQKETG